MWPISKKRKEKKRKEKKRKEIPLLFRLKTTRRERIQVIFNPRENKGPQSSSQKQKNREENKMGKND